jgi:glycosyltransferase involved in cell wall biosynthesis
MILPCCRTPDGPFVYAGSIANQAGIETMIAASGAAAMPLKIIGGAKEEWQRLSRANPAGHVTWQAHVGLAELPAALAGARAGLVPPQLESPAGRHRSPLKLFDYARCGLPVLSAALACLDSLDAGSWCVRVETPTTEAWAEAMRTFRGSAVLDETARAWAGAHTWTQRAEKLLRVLQRPAR